MKLTKVQTTEMVLFKIINGKLNTILNIKYEIWKTVYYRKLQFSSINNNKKHKMLQELETYQNEIPGLSRTFQALLFGFQVNSNQKSHLSNNNIIIFQILMNKLIQQNGTNKVQHMQRMQWLWQL